MIPLQSPENALAAYDNMYILSYALYSRQENIAFQEKIYWMISIRDKSHFLALRKFQRRWVQCKGLLRAHFQELLVLQRIFESFQFCLHIGRFILLLFQLVNEGLKADSLLRRRVAKVHKCNHTFDVRPAGPQL